MAPSKSKELKRIEHSKSRQQSFSQRRRTLRIKSQELAILTGSHVEVAITNEHGKVESFKVSDHGTLTDACPKKTALKNCHEGRHEPLNKPLLPDDEATSGIGDHGNGEGIEAGLCGTLQQHMQRSGLISKEATPMQQSLFTGTTYGDLDYVTGPFTLTTAGMDVITTDFNTVFLAGNMDLIDTTLFTTTAEMDVSTGFLDMASIDTTPFTTTADINTGLFAGEIASIDTTSFTAEVAGLVAGKMELMNTHRMPGVGYEFEGGNLVDDTYGDGYQYKNNDGRSGPHDEGLYPAIPGLDQGFY